MLFYAYCAIISQIYVILCLLSYGAHFGLLCLLCHNKPTVCHTMPTRVPCYAYNVWRVKGNALRLRLTGSVVQPRVSDDLLTYKAIGSNYLSFVVTSMLVSTSPLDEAGTATHLPLSESSGRKGPANVVSSADHPITSGSPVVVCQKGARSACS